MNLELLSIFIDVAQQGSFAKVAKQRGVDPSSISRAIANLEKQHKVRLFQRTTRRIALTEAGNRYLSRITPIFEELEKANEELISSQNELKGTLKISTSIAFGYEVLIPILKQFRQEHPQVNVDLQLDDKNSDLIENRIDFAIRLNDQAGTQFIRSQLKQTQYRLCASPEYVATHHNIKEPKDLTQHDIITFDLPRYKNRWQFQKERGEVFNLPITPQLCISNALVIKKSTQQGMGVSLLADWLVDKDIQSGKLIQLLPEYQVSADNFNTGLWIVYPDRQFLPTKTRKAIDFIKANIYD